MTEKHDLYSQAKYLADKHKKVEYKRSVRRDLLDIERNSQVLLDAYKRLMSRLGQTKVIPAAEWLLDLLYAGRAV